MKKATPNKNIVTLQQIGLLRKKWPKVVLVGGAFDILHHGHIEHLEEAKSQGKTLVVCVVGDKRVREKKGPNRPIISEKERARIVASIKPVDYVFIYNGRHYDKTVISKVRPDILFFHKEDYAKIKMVSVLPKDFSCKVYVSKQKKIGNSSHIINKIIESKVMQKGRAHDARPRKD